MSLLKMKSSWELIIFVGALFAISLHLVFNFSIYPLIFIIIFGGIPLFLQILIKLLKGDLGADSLAALALITSVILQEYLAATIIIFMLASGQTLEQYALHKASSVLEALIGRMPEFAHRKKKQRIEQIPLTQIKIGDTLLVYPHETCPADGIVKEGHGSMDESYLTGEPYQIAKAPGASVLSGAINGESLLLIQATTLSSDSRFAAIVKVLEEAEQKRPNLRRLGDQMGAIFAPLALLFAVLTWYFTGESIRFLAVLVIATPCPLLIAIPITIISAISKAAKQSIIIKDPTVLERLPTCTTAIFDKTGTLTYGKPSLVHMDTVPDVDAKRLLVYVASLEQYSKHPLASAILKAAKEQHLELIPSTQVSEIPGQGLHGIVDKHNIHITSRKQLLLQAPAQANKLPEMTSGLECIVILNKHYAASLQFKDAPRAESKPFISHLMPYHQFNKIMLVSGDRESEVSYLAKLLNLTQLHASQSPEQKLAIVREESSKAPTLFMGDGINDAPALTAATVGIAFGQHSNVTAEASGVVIMENSLSKVDELFHLSILTRRIALESALGGMILSIIGMGFAAFGYIHPVSGAILQEVIDVFAIINALRLAMGNKIKTDFEIS